MSAQWQAYCELKKLAERLAEYETAIGGPSPSGRAELERIALERALPYLAEGEMKVIEP